MDVQLIRAGVQDAERLWRMQVEAFRELYDKYQDTETSPAAEPLEKTIARLNQPFTYYYIIQYIIQADGAAVGAIRVIDRQDPAQLKKISPIFILPPWRNRGIAHRAMLAAEKLHGQTNWALETILQEEGNCHLYEKMGYRRTGKITVVNDRMTLVEYRKDE